MKRRIPIDFATLSKENDIRKGNVGYNDLFGWHIRNEGMTGSDIAMIEPPASHARRRNESSYIG